jgi:predicted DNA-binding transcriptional regulator AlpA
MSLEHYPARQGCRAAQTVCEFCDDNRISRSKFYQLIDQGIAPRIMRVGAKVLITAEAAAEWRAAREAASETQAA